MHGGRAPVEHLHPVHADVAPAGAGVLRDHRRERDEGRRVAGPTGLDGERVEIDLVAGEDDLLRRAAADPLRLRVGDRLQLLEPANLLRDPLRRLHLEDVADPLARVVERVDPEREAHPTLGTELVDQQRVARLRVLEEQRRPAGLDHAVGDLGDLEARVDLGGDANELALALEQCDPLAEVSHGGQSRTERAYRTASSSDSVRPTAWPRSNAAP